MLLVTECFLHLHWGLSEPPSTEIKIHLSLNHVISNYSKWFYFFFLHDLSWVLPTVYLKAKAGRCSSLSSFIKHSNKKWCYLLFKCISSHLQLETHTQSLAFQLAKLCHVFSSHLWAFLVSHPPLLKFFFFF